MYLINPYLQNKKPHRKLNCHRYVQPTTTTPKPYPLSTIKANNPTPSTTTTTTRATPREATPPRPSHHFISKAYAEVHISLEVPYTNI